MKRVNTTQKGLRFAATCLVLFWGVIGYAQNAAVADHPKGATMKTATQITMTAGKETITATLDDSSTTRDFIKSLPVSSVRLKVEQI